MIQSLKERRIGHMGKAEQVQHTLGRLRSLSDGIDESIYIIDPETYEILFANAKTQELFGKGIRGKKCFRVFQNRSKPCPNCTNKHVLGENLGKTHTWNHQNRRNKQWYRGIYKAIEWPGNKHVKYGIAIDIIRQKRIEENLRESEEFFRSIVEHSYGSILIVDDNFDIVYANEETSKLSGYSNEEIVGKHFSKFLDEDYRSVVENRYLPKLREEMSLSQYAFRIVRKDGEKREVEVKSEAIQDRHGKMRIIVQLLDITERKKMENERKHYEERLSALNTYGQSLNMARNMDDIHWLILDAMDETLGFEFADVFIEDGKMLRLIAHRGNSIDKSLELPIDGNKGIAAQVARTASSIFVPNVTKNKEYIKGGEGVLSELAVPIKAESKVLGVLNVESKKLAGFCDDDRELLEILASHAAIAITNLKRQERLSALNEYGQSLNMARSLKEIYMLTQNAMEKILGFEYASVLVVEGRKLVLVAHHGYPHELGLILPLDQDRGLTVRAVRKGKPIFVPDIRREKTYIKGGEDILSELAVPIKVGNKILGILNIESKKLAAFDESDRELCEILASHVAIAMTNLKKQAKLSEISERLEYLMENTTEIMHVKKMHQRLKVIAKAIREFGWRRIVISLRDEKLEGTDLVTAGLTRDENKLLRKRKALGHVWRKRLGPSFRRYKIGEFYYLPWADPWIRENVHGVPRGASIEKATTYAGVPSRLTPSEMVDWHPQDMLYAPLRTPEGRIVGILSMDDPVDGRKPTSESLTPLELFLHQAAIVIENAQLIEGLKEAREQLGQKVEERTRELKESQGQLLRAQRLGVIGELAGMVGHDLRNPLTSIAGAVYYMKKQLRSGAVGKAEEMLELIEKNIVYSNKIINDLLDYSREMKLDLTENDPRSIIRDVLSLVEIPRRIGLVDLTESEPRMRVDVEKLKRAFANIIRNAVDAMPRNGTLTIKSGRLHGNLAFTFSDTGIGISKETLAKLWTPLFTTKAKGMGFGLPICKRIIEAHGGSISAKSVVKKGTTFTVTLPIEPKTDEGGEKIWVKLPESSLLTTTRT